jgi:UDP-glucose 4-epimerase
VREITGKDFQFYEVDLLDRDGVENVFSNNDIQAVIHFAGLKAVMISQLNW